LTNPPTNPVRRTATGVLQLVLVVYAFGVMGSGAYFNWTYARDNGFIKWLLLGQIVPSAKAFIWPYFTYEHFEAKARRAAEDAALDHSPHADSVRVVLMTTVAMQDLIQETAKGVRDTGAVVRTLRAELSQVDAVSREALDAVYQGWGGATKDALVPAMRNAANILDPASPLHGDRGAFRLAFSEMLGQMSVFDTWLETNRSAWMEALLSHRIVPAFTGSVGNEHRL
jgi:hypothetical protein